MTTESKINDMNKLSRKRALSVFYVNGKWNLEWNEQVVKKM